jgi:hypothetical protein
VEHQRCQRAGDILLLQHAPCVRPRS